MFERLPLRYILVVLLSILIQGGVLAATQTMDMQIEGLSGPLQDNVKARMSQFPVDQISASAASRHLIKKEITTALQALGYYHPRIEFALKYATPPQNSTLIVMVHPEQPILIDDINVKIEGQGEDDKDYLTLLKTAVPEKGSILNHRDYDNFKDALNELALSKGYFQSSFKRSELQIAPGLNKAFWVIDFDTGPRYRYGKTAIKVSNIDEQYLRNLQPFKEGDYYLASQLANYNRQLTATNWFQSALVTPNFEKIKEGNTLPITVETFPLKKNLIELGVGYSTDTRAHTKISWSKPWLNRFGHSLQATTAISSKKQTFDVSYKIPLLKSPVEQYYTLQGGVQNEKNIDTDSKSYLFDVSRYWQLTSGWQRIISLRSRYDAFTQGMEKNNSFLFYPGVAISRTRQSEGMMPLWGDSQRYSLDVSNHIWGSDIDFFIFRAQNTWIRTYYERNRFIFRSTFGWLESNNFQKLPPSLRFFAGGDRSIRGYGYKSLSPRDSSGKLMGGSRLFLGSLEYQYNLTGAWWSAMFIDSGEAVNDFNRHDLKTGIGVGVRWSSPVGPVRFDIARPVSDTSTKPVFYLGIGSEL